MVINPIDQNYNLQPTILLNHFFLSFDNKIPNFLGEKTNNYNSHYSKCVLEKPEREVLPHLQ